MPRQGFGKVALRSEFGQRDVLGVFLSGKVENTRHTIPETHMLQPLDNSPWRLSIPIEPASFTYSIALLSQLPCESLDNNQTRSN